MHLSSPENHVVQSCRLNSLVQYPPHFWLCFRSRCVYSEGVSHTSCIWKTALLSQRCTVYNTYCIGFYIFLSALLLSTALFSSPPPPPVHRRAGRSDHVSSLPAGPSHDRQGARLLERRHCHGLLHLRLVFGRPAACSVQVIVINAIVLFVIWLNCDLYCMLRLFVIDTHMFHLKIYWRILQCSIFTKLQINN